MWLMFASGILAYYVLNYTSLRLRGWHCLPLVIGIIYAVADPRQGTFLDGKWLMVLSGILACYIFKYAPHRKRGWLYLPLALGIIYAIMDHQQLLKSRYDEPNENYVVAFSFALLIIGLKKWDGFITNSRIFSPFRFCGEMCYSLYLVHWPTVTIIGHMLDLLGITNPVASLLITVPCCVGTTVLLGRAFHLLIERKFWNFKNAA
jgi:peptidoglycan/LPS O-acetylase OafA/YrhL